MARRGRKKEGKGDERRGKERGGNGEMRSGQQMNEPFNRRLSQRACNNFVPNKFFQRNLFVFLHKLKVIYGGAFCTPTQPFV